jgi:subtilisin family serine protease
VTQPADLRDSLRPQIADEAEHLIGAFRDHPDGAREITVVPANGGIDHMHAEGEILVREEHLDRVLEAIDHPARQALEQSDPPRLRRVIAGFVVVTLGDSYSTVAAAIDRVDERLGRGIATPNHVLTVCGDGDMHPCPATEPEEAYYECEPYPHTGDSGAGGGVRIYVADTGLLRNCTEGHAWLAGVDMQDAGLDCDPARPMTGNPPQIPAYTGHGTFVAGVLRSVAPAAEVIVTNAFSVAGSALESDFVARLESAFRLGVDIFQLDIAAGSRNDIPLMAFGAWLKRVTRSKGTICLSPAGNSARRRPNWPAAFPGVIAVGALGRDWRSRASFSNFGPWVDVYAPGRDIVNAYATGRYTCHVSPYKGQVRNFYGMAKWSGTSFAAPIVSGMIAARMSSTGENAREAAQSVLAQARDQAIPGVGPVLLPPR